MPEITNHLVKAQGLLALALFYLTDNCKDAAKVTMYHIGNMGYLRGERNEYAQECDRIVQLISDDAPLEEIKQGVALFLTRKSDAPLYDAIKIGVKKLINGMKVSVLLQKESPKKFIVYYGNEHGEERREFPSLMAVVTHVIEEFGNDDGFKWDDNFNKALTLLNEEE